MAYINFKKISSKINHENDYNFELKINTMKNIYYSFRYNALVFKKNNKFENNKTLNNKLYLRDGCHTFIYENLGNKIYNHEHAIFISSFQIHKLNNSTHLYFDGTLLYLCDFKQLLIFLYLDKEINKKAQVPIYYLITKGNKVILEY